MGSSWIRCRTRRPEAGLRVVCLPHAGGSASFFGGWGQRVSDDVEVSAVQYPGREDRITEACQYSLDELVGEVAAAVLPLADRPLVVFGHSLGSLVAYEVAKLLEHRHGVGLARLVVSGRRAPSVPVTGDIHRRADDPLIDELVRLGGTDGELLRNPGFSSVFLPAIRADFALAETYRHREGVELTCQITAVIGSEDTEVDAAQARRWADHTAGSFDFHELPGGHFYLIHEEAAVLDLLSPTGALQPSIAGESE